MEVQLESLKVLWETLEEPLQLHYADAVVRLEKKILAAFESVKHIRQLGAVDSTMYQKIKAVYLRKHVKQAASDLESWQRQFDPSWYLITRITSNRVDEQLRNDLPNQNSSTARLARMRNAIKETSSSENDRGGLVFIDASLIKKNSHVIPGTNMYEASYDQHRPVLLDRTNYSPLTAKMIARRYIHDLARLLMNVDPMTFGLLKCGGVVELPEENCSQFQFVLELPKDLPSPRTLRTILMETPQCPLNHRIQLAKQLARSVMFVHTSGFVHKNIRPETILVFTDGPKTMGPSFLSGFERVRPSGASTEQSGDLEWEKNFYRHPVRQGLWPEELYKVQHDIYSLGVCLLELALWHSFAQYDVGFAVPCPELNVSKALSDKDRRRGAFAIKKELVTMAEDRLPGLIGERYASLTVTCLNCLDSKENNIFHFESSRKDEKTVVGVRYIENVSQLEYNPELNILLTASRFYSKLRRYVFKAFSGPWELRTLSKMARYSVPLQAAIFILHSENSSALQG